MLRHLLALAGLQVQNDKDACCVCGYITEPLHYSVRLRCVAPTDVPVSIAFQDVLLLKLIKLPGTALQASSCAGSRVCK